MNPFQQAWQVLKLERNPVSPVPIVGTQRPTGMIDGQPRGSIRNKEKDDMRQRMMEMAMMQGGARHALQPPEGLVQAEKEDALMDNKLLTESAGLAGDKDDEQMRLGNFGSLTG